MLIHTQSNEHLHSTEDIKTNILLFSNFRKKFQSHLESTTFKVQSSILPKGH